MVKRLLIWLAQRSITGIYADLNEQLSKPRIGAEYLDSQLHQIDRLERRVIALQS